MIPILCFSANSRNRSELSIKFNEIFTLKLIVYSHLTVENCSNLPIEEK